MSADLASGWALDGQVLGLMHAAPQHWPGERILGIVINVVVRTKEPQFKRVTLPMRPDLVAVWLDAMQGWIERVLPFYEAQGWPPNYASCIHRYGHCPFYADCETASNLEATQ
jgi:hypothetical protein